MMQVQECQKIKLEKLKRHGAKGNEQASRGETTEKHNKNELHSLLTAIKRQNRSR